MKQRPTFLELGRRHAFGRPVRKPLGPVAPPPDPKTVADFDLGTWRVRPSLARMTRVDRIVPLDEQTLLVLLILAERPPGGVNRDELAARVFGLAGPELHAVKLRRCMGHLRRAFSEDGAVRIVNAPDDCFVLEVGAPDPDRGLRDPGSDVLLENPGAIQAWLRRGRHRGLSLGLAAVVVVLIAIALVLLVDRRHVVMFGHIESVVALATEPGAKLHPSLSPDGRQVVYAWRRPDGTEKLYVRPVTGGAPRVLTAGDGKDSFPAWSPKGDLIAFQRRGETSCAVLAIAPTGGEMRLLGDCDFGGGGPMTWLRDGSALVYTHRTDWSLPTQLVSVSVTQPAIIGVTNPVTGMPGDSSPSLATTGRRLAFVRTRATGAADLYMLELGGTAPERITRDGVPTAGSAWEAAGLSLIFSSPRGGREALWRSRADGTLPELVLARGEPLAAPALSGDGRELAFERWRIASRVARVGFEPAPAGAPAAAQAWREHGDLARGIHLSADRTRLAFVSNEGGHERLYVAPAEGGGATAVTRSDFEYLEAPRWSQDGRFVAFTAARQGALDVWVVEVATGREERITNDGKSRAPSFSRDGRWIYFGSSRSGRWQIWRRAWPDAGAPEQVTAEGGLAALESDDGSLLYFVRPDRMGLWQRPRTPGGDDTLVTPELAPLDFRNWDVTADAVWFVVRPTQGPPVLARFAFAQGRVTRGREVPAILPDSGLAPAADGRTVWLAEQASAQVDLELATLE